jgi:hypothetical protein
MQVDTEIAVDRKTASQRWHSLTDRPHQHFYKQFEDVVDGKGPCSVHQCHCTVPLRPDLATIGLSCQPFSAQRDQRSTKPCDHALYQITFQAFPAYLQKVNPRGFVAEQVLGFNRSDPDDAGGRTYLQFFCMRVAELGYSVRVAKLDSGVWSESERARRSCASVSFLKRIFVLQDFAPTACVLQLRMFIFKLALQCCQSVHAILLHP